MSDYNDFVDESIRNVKAQAGDPAVLKASRDFLLATAPYKYSYNFEWMGRPIIQFPQDMVAMQEIIWNVKPDLVIETGIAHGGSLVFTASLLALLDLCEARGAGRTMDPSSPKRKVVGVDIDIREHNRIAIESHPMAPYISMIEGSSIDSATIDQVGALVGVGARVLVCLDSNHTHEHVLEELRAYSPFVTSGSYCVVFDTAVEMMPEGSFPDRPWGKGDNPWTAVHEFLSEQGDFEVDELIPQKLLLTVAPDGFLRRK